MLDTGSLPSPKFRYAPAVVAGPWIRTAGMVGLDPATGQLVEGGPGAEFERILTTLEAMMADNRLGPEHLKIATLYVTDFSRFPEVNDVWERHFPQDGPLPARTALGVSALPVGASIEAEFAFYREER